MKRALRFLAVAVLFLNTFAVLTVAQTDGGGGTSTGCGGSTICKP